MKWTSNLNITHKLSFFIVLGIIGGSVSGFILSKGETVATSMLDSFIYLKQFGNFFELTYYTFLPVFIVLVLNYFDGYSILTGFVKYIVSFCVGTAIGMFSTMIYRLFDNGIYYSLFIFLPFGILFALIILLSLRESHKLSVVCYKMLFNDIQPDNKEKLFKEYIVKLILLLSITFIISILNATANSIFFKFFILFD